MQRFSVVESEMASNKGNIAKACKDMKRLYGIPEAKVKAALKRLLRLYGNQWGFIEENNYELLLDLTVQDNKQGEDYKTVESKTRGSLIQEGKRSELEVVQVLLDDEPQDPEPLLKRCLKNHNEQLSTSIDKTQRSLIRAQDQAAAVLEIEEPARDHLSQSKRARISYYGAIDDIKGKKPAIAETAGGNALDIGNGRAVVTQKNTLEMYNNFYLEPFQEELARAVIPPDSPKLELVSFDNGEVKSSLIYSSSLKYLAKVPSLDIIRVVEDRIRKRYGITDPDQYSVMKLMRELCECFLAMGTNFGNGVLPLPMFDILKKSEVEFLTNGKDHHQSNSNQQLPSCSNVSVDPPSQNNVDDCNGKSVQNTYLESEQKMAAVTENGKFSNSCGMKDDQKHNPPFNVAKNPIVIEDITRGEERQPISLVNENGALKLPKFFYISQNTIHKNAYVNFSLARISEDDCCSNCSGDCLLSPENCACTGETRGDFAYTPPGLVGEKFLNECIAMSRRKVSKDHLFYCENCPLENSLGKSSKQLKRKRLVKPCKGHLMRKFIKECWAKCGCSKNCGNRIVQRGITVKLQVFQTPQGKGWGLRTLEELEKGTFVCEYVGEIVTNEELHERNEESAGEEHTYPVLLDADWASERHLKDEEALCLDATKFGNAARFINHRCYDANLVDIPVEVETPDHHYYHIAFFTTRKIEANEELTWDYGIDFEDETHPIKAFKCKCGSSFCCMKGRS